MRKSGENIVYFTHWDKSSNKATSSFFVVIMDIYFR